MTRASPRNSCWTSTRGDRYILGAAPFDPDELLRGIRPGKRRPNCGLGAAGRLTATRFSKGQVQMRLVSFVLVAVSSPGCSCTTPSCLWGGFWPTRTLTNRGRPRGAAVSGVARRRIDSALARATSSFRWTGHVSVRRSWTRRTSSSAGQLLRASGGGRRGPPADADHAGDFLKPRSALSGPTDRSCGRPRPRSSTTRPSSPSSSARWTPDPRRPRRRTHCGYLITNDVTAAISVRAEAEVNMAPLFQLTRLKVGTRSCRRSWLVTADEVGSYADIESRPG